MKNFVHLFVWLTVIGLIAGSVQSLRRLDPFSRLNKDFYDAGMGGIGLRMEDVSLLISSKGKPVTRLNADRIDLTRDRREWTVHGITNGKLYREGKPTAEFGSKQVTYDTGMQTITATDSSLRVKEAVLTVPQMSWTQNQNIVIATKQVHGKLRGGPLEAQTAELDLNKRSLLAGKGAWKPKLKERGGRRLSLRWESLRAVEQERTAQMTTVEIVDGDLSASAASAIFDDKNDTVIARRAVTLRSSQFELHGAYLALYRTERRLTLTGQPTVQGKDTKNGIDIISCAQYDLDEKSRTHYLTACELFDRKEQATIKAARATYNEKTQILEAEGKLWLSDEELDINADKMSMDRKKQVAVLTGGLKIVVKPKKAEKTEPPPSQPPPATGSDSANEARKKPITITADKLEYYFGKKRVAILAGNVSAKQELEEGHWRMATAESAHYDRDTERMVLTGAIVLKDDRGSIIRPKYLTIVTKEGEEKVEMLAPTGSIHLDEEETKPEDENKDAVTPPEPPKPPAR